MIPEELRHDVDQGVFVGHPKSDIGLQIRLAGPGPAVDRDPQHRRAEFRAMGGRRWIELACRSIRQDPSGGGWSPIASRTEAVRSASRLA
jgi:hypothetical protein